MIIALLIALTLGSTVVSASLLVRDVLRRRRRLAAREQLGNAGMYPHKLLIGGLGERTVRWVAIGKGPYDKRPHLPPLVEPTEDEDEDEDELARRDHANSICPLCAYGLKGCRWSSEDPSGDRGAWSHPDPSMKKSR